MNEQQIFSQPLPEQTDSYQPVPHQMIDELVHENIDKIGMQVISKNLIANKEAQIVTGYLDLESESKTFGYRVAWQNSYNKARPVAFVAGTSVLICSNGMIIGDSKFVRKHTGSVQEEMQIRIEQTMLEIRGMLETSEHQAERMKQIELDPTATAELCGRLLMEQEIITSSQLSIIRQEYKNPTYPELAEPNLWGLYNHATHALKKTHAYNFIEAHQRLHKFVEAEYELI